jgi:HlyD family secretion protein
MSWPLNRIATRVLIGLLLAALFGMLAWYWLSPRTRQDAFRKEAVRRGDLVATVSATGTIEPEEVVDIGAQVVGMIKEFGRDLTDSTRLIDYGSAVEEGTVLARIDDSLYRARLDRAVAQVGRAKAQVVQAQADLVRAQANLEQSRTKHVQAELDWERARKLLSGRAMSREEYDARQAARGVTRAEVRVNEAAIEQARANKLANEKALLSAEAEQREAQKNLDYCVIRSPVKGVIIDRRVNVGQTVVSSLNAPSLFLIARDLKRLQIWASVNEADVGRIRPRQAVRFTVDAFSGEVFRGTVTQVRLNATMTQNVVTYTVVVTTDNSDGKLLPYLTTNARFEIDRRVKTLLVPTAALRWQPLPHQIAPNIRDTVAGEQSKQQEGRSDVGTVWVEVKGFVRPIEVKTGLSDGLLTEITAGELREGQLVVVGEVRQTDGSGTTNPFTPNIIGGKRP